MVNVVLYVVAAVLVVAIIAASIYLVVYFGSEEDNNTAYLPKGIVVCHAFLFRSKALNLFPPRF